MSTKPKKGLGRGFDSLIPSDLLDESFDPTSSQDGKVSELRNIKLSVIKADPNQPRSHFEEVGLKELSHSIKEHGVLQPIVVVTSGDGYQIVAGERRYRAAKMAGLDKVPALVRTLSDQHKLELSLIENIQRRDLNPLETATAYLKLRDQFNMTLDQIGQRVGGKSVSSISNTLRLLRLPDVVQLALLEGDLSEGQARPLIDVDTAVIKELLPQIIAEDWSARRVEQFIAHLKKHGITPSKPETAPKKGQPDYRDNAKRLAERFAAKVQISSGVRGTGKIVISFKNSEEFERISKLLES